MLSRKKNFRTAALRAFAAAGALLGALAPAVAHAQLFDLTGTWTGSITCKSFDAGTKRTFSLTPVLQVTQSGNAVGARLDFGGGNTDRYTGLANPDGKKPATKGEVALIRCGTDSSLGNEPDLDEIGRLKATTKSPPAIKASLKGSSVFSDAGAVAPEAGTCTWKWTRVDLANPAVPTNCDPN